MLWNLLYYLDFLVKRLKVTDYYNVLFEQGIEYAENEQERLEETEILNKLLSDDEKLLLLIELLKSPLDPLDWYDWYEDVGRALAAPPLRFDDDWTDVYTLSTFCWKV